MACPGGDAVWYAAYGSNLSWARFRCYLEGGTPPRGRRPNPGARDPSPPRRDAGVRLCGTVYFAGRTSTWGGAVAVYDPTAEPPSGAGVLARAYLITKGQLADVIAQEMGRRPGGDAGAGDAGGGDPADVPLGGPAGSRHQLGPGRYETLVACGGRDGLPMVTITAPWSLGDVEPSPPGLAYLATMAEGLGEAHTMDGQGIARYLARLPGARGHWSADALAEWLLGG